jgi:membrane protein implicated in regulation of membrane protease activity
MHHLLLLLPFLALGLFIFLPWPLALPLYLFILIGSIAAYWKALQALRQPPVMGRSTMIGDLAVVVRAEKNDVQVEYKGEIWSAVSSRPLQLEQKVIIEKVDALTLRVAPLSPSQGNAAA